VSESFEPRIAVFLCNWSLYAGADKATACLSSLPNILPIRVMCSGQVSPEMILRAFRAGVDGVLVLGCRSGDCHYISSGRRAVRRVPLVRNLFDYVSINPDRLRLDWVPSVEAPKFAKVTQEFVEAVRALGPISDEVGA